MEQTFCDACRANAWLGRGFFGFVLWLYIDTAGGIVSEHARHLLVRHKSIVRAALVTLGFLLLPLCGTLYIDDWNWGWRGFAVVGAFVFGAALAFELAIRGVSDKAYRFAMGLAVATTLALSWSNFVLAVDVSLANFMYLGVVVIGLVGSAIARLRARGMALALAAMAIAQILVPLIALVFLKTRVAPGAIIGGNGVCMVLFAISALLFRRAGTHDSPG
jgi:MFS family permease